MSKKLEMDTQPSEGGGLTTTPPNFIFTPANPITVLREKPEPRRQQVEKARRTRAQMVQTHLEQRRSAEKKTKNHGGTDGKKILVAKGQKRARTKTHSWGRGTGCAWASPTRRANPECRAMSRAHCASWPPPSHPPHRRGYPPPRRGPNNPPRPPPPPPGIYERKTEKGPPSKPQHAIQLGHRVRSQGGKSPKKLRLDNEDASILVERCKGKRTISREWITRHE